MLNKYAIGKFGQDIVEKKFISDGFEILDKNKKYNIGELDLVCKKGGKIFFIEVKTRTNNSYGEIENSISDYKLKSLESAIARYLEEKNVDVDYSLIFAFVFIDRKNKKARIRLLEY